MSELIHILYLTTYLPMLLVEQFTVSVTSLRDILDMYSGQGVLPEWMQMGHIHQVHISVT
jgi:hypothetical protein